MAEGESLAANSLSFQVIDFVEFENRHSSNPAPGSERALHVILQVVPMVFESRMVRQRPDVLKSRNTRCDLQYKDEEFQIEVRALLDHILGLTLAPPSTSCLWRLDYWVSGSGRPLSRFLRTN